MAEVDLNPLQQRLVAALLECSTLDDADAQQLHRAHALVLAAGIWGRVEELLRELRDGCADPARSVERLRLALKQLSDDSVGALPRAGDGAEVVRTVMRAADITRRDSEDAVDTRLLVALAELQEHFRLALEDLSDDSVGSLPRPSDRAEAMHAVTEDAVEEGDVDPGLLVALGELRERNPVLADALAQAVNTGGRTSLDDLDAAVAQRRAGAKDPIVNESMFEAARTAGATKAKSVGNFLRKAKNK